MTRKADSISSAVAAAKSDDAIHVYPRRRLGAGTVALMCLAAFAATLLVGAGMNLLADVAEDLLADAGALSGWTLNDLADLEVCIGVPLALAIGLGILRRAKGRGRDV